MRCRAIGCEVSKRSWQLSASTCSSRSSQTHVGCSKSAPDVTAANNMAALNGHSEAIEPVELVPCLPQGSNDDLKRKLPDHPKDCPSKNIRVSPDVANMGSNMLDSELNRKKMVAVMQENKKLKDKNNPRMTRLPALTDALFSPVNTRIEVKEYAFPYSCDALVLYLDALVSYCYAVIIGHLVMNLLLKLGFTDIDILGTLDNVVVVSSTCEIHSFTVNLSSPVDMDTGSVFDWEIASDPLRDNTSNLNLSLISH
ncbi:hypothetical protein Tco_0400749 [Tanacetum coccineum]